MKLKDGIPMLQAIAVRRSVRTFDGRPFDSAERRSLESFAAAAAVGPFGSAPRFALLSSEAISADGKSVKIGTYGIIRSPAAYIAVVAPSRSDKALFDAGFSAESLVLEMTRAGLGSCWLGGTFKKGPVISAAGVTSEEALVALIALGHAADRRGFMDTLIFTASGRGQRKAFSDLFRDVRTGASPEAVGEGSRESPLGRLMEALRCAPSASNKQPWRFNVELASGNEDCRILRTDLYLARDSRYEDLAGYRIQNVDAGIVSSHAELAAAELGYDPARRFTPLPGTEPWENAEFVLGWDFNSR